MKQLKNNLVLDYGLLSVNWSLEKKDHERLMEFELGLERVR